MWNLNTLLSHPRSSLDRCFHRCRSDRLFSDNRTVSESARPLNHTSPLHPAGLFRRALIDAFRQTLTSDNCGLFHPSCRSARRRVSCHAVLLAWLVGKPADSSVSDFLGQRIPRAPSRPSRFARCCHPCPCPRILVTSLAVSWLRPSLNEDPCGLFAAAVLFCWFLPAVGYALSHPLWSALLSSITSFWTLGFFAFLDHPSRSCSPCLLASSRCSLFLSVRHALRDLVFRAVSAPQRQCLRVRRSRSASAELTPPVQCEA